MNHDPYYPPPDFVSNDVVRCLTDQPMVLTGADTTDCS